MSLDPITERRLDELLAVQAITHHPETRAYEASVIDDLAREGVFTHFDYENDNA